MTSRLPVPGSDDNQWGNILNDFLAVEHNSDGSLKAGGSLAAKYAKPTGGIPQADLDAAVQARLTTDATASTKGIVKLAGDLGGTADAPTVPSKVSKAGDTMTGALTVPTLKVTVGANDGYVLTSDATGQAQWSAVPGQTVTGPNYLRGVSLSGFEFSPSVVPGALSITYFAPAAGDYAYFKSKGLTVVRLPFTWDRLQPILNGPLDTAYKGYLDQAIAYAKANGQQVVLDMHSYGRRYVPIPGGFTNDFATSTGTWSGGSLSGGRYISDPNSFFSNFSGGDVRNPVSPATGYSFQADCYITSSQTGGSNFPALHVKTFNDGNGNYYQLSINQYEQKFKWAKSVASTITNIGEVATTVSLDTLYQVVFDVNQASAGNVTISINGTQVAQFATDPAITGGRVELKNNFTKCAIDNATLNIAGDTSAANGSGTYRVGDAQIPVSAFADVWSKLATAYVSESTIYMYDLMNEPHDMPVPTTTSNYNTTATVTLMYQAAIDAIRTVDNHTYIAVEADQWSGLQSFNTQYGTDPSPWWSDPSGKTMVSFHYYFDTDHSGSYQTAWSSTLRTRLSGEVTPALAWAQTHSIPVFVGEYGVPNGVTSDAVNWQQDEDTFLGILDSYGAHATHWAGGSNYTASTTLEPYTSGVADYTKEVEQMAVVKAHLGRQLTALPTTQGGTGLAAAGSTGNVLTSDGTNWTSAVPANGLVLETTTTPPATSAAGGVLGVAATAAHSDHTHAIGVHDHSNTANGGNVYAPNILTYSLQAQTTVNRVENLPRFLLSSGSDTATSGSVFLAYFTPDFNFTASNFVSSTTGTAGSGATLARMGLYTVNGSNNLTCVARTASDTTTLWTTANTVYTRAIADNGAASPATITSYALTRGSRYAVAFLFVGTTVPSLASKTFANGAIGSLSPIMLNLVSGQSDMVSAYTNGQTVGTTKYFWGALT